MGMLGVNPTIKMEVLGSSFQYGKKNSMLVEALEEYVLDSVEYDYEEPGKQAPMILMTSGGELHDPKIILTGWIRNALHLPDQLA